MQLTLLVPGLLLPQAVLGDMVFDLAAPALSLLLGRGQRVEADPGWLSRAFNAPAPLPAAALRKVGAGGTAHGTLLCLDPVHWAVGREGITLADPAQLDLSEKEAAALIEAVQPIFADWGEFSATSPRHWEFRLARSLLLDTRPLPECIGLPIDPGLPAGLDGPAWCRMLAEAQTVLHAHPVNRQREATGRPTVSSVWPWGQGGLPETAHTDFTVAWSNDPVVAGLCALAGIPCIAPPEQFRPASGNVLCCIDHLAHAARTRNALAWRDGLLALERDWIAPAIAALRKNECHALRVVGSSVYGTPHVVIYSLVRGNLWRFWQRPAPLDALA